MRRNATKSNETPLILILIFILILILVLIFIFILILVVLRGNGRVAEFYNTTVYYA